MKIEQVIELYMETAELYTKAVDFLIYEASRDDCDENIIGNLKKMIVAINNIMATLQAKIREREGKDDGKEKQG